MSRSYRKAVLVDGSGSSAPRRGKTRHNHNVRRLNDDIPDGNYYRKLNCAWDYRDYAFDYRYYSDDEIAIYQSQRCYRGWAIKLFKRAGIWHMWK